MLLGKCVGGFNKQLICPNQGMLSWYRASYRCHPIIVLVCPVWGQVQHTECWYAPLYHAPIPNWYHTICWVLYVWNSMAYLGLNHQLMNRKVKRCLVYVSSKLNACGCGPVGGEREGKKVASMWKHIDNVKGRLSFQWCSYYSSQSPKLLFPMILLARHIMEHG